MKKFLYIFFVLLIFKIASPHYYCIPADDKHFDRLKNLIGSIHRYDFDNLKEVAVFNLGFNQKQIKEIKTMRKVRLCNVEMVNPDLLKYFKTASNGRQVRGYFAWKPVVIKQSLDMYPYVLYLDAGSTILAPLNNIFTYIKEQGYFLVSCTNDPNCNIVNRITKKVLETIISKLDPIMQLHLLKDDTIEIDAGMQGVSRKMLNDYVAPIYNHAKDLSLFADDGTAKYGYGAGRHDQILFSIYAHALKLNIFPEGWIDLDKVRIHISNLDINKDTVIYRSREDIKFMGGHSQFVKYK